MSPRRAVVVPSTLALLPEYAGLTDPVADLRAACLDAVRWLVEGQPDGIAVARVEQRADNLGRGASASAGDRIARHLLTEAGFGGPAGSGTGLLVVGNGSARRTEKAPGHLDDRAADFDARLGAALREGDPDALLALDEPLAEELWCHDVPAFRALGRWSIGPVTATIDYEDAESGVMYWVARWSCGS